MNNESRPVDFMTQPAVPGHTPMVAFSIRIGSWLLTNDGLFRWWRIVSRNGKIHRYDWMPVFRRKSNPQQREQ